MTIRGIVDFIFVLVLCAVLVGSFTMTGSANSELEGRTMEVYLLEQRVKELEAAAAAHYEVMRLMDVELERLRGE